MMARKYRILLPLADGAFMGLCSYLAAALLLSQIFPVSTPSFYLLAGATAVVSAIPLWMILPRYSGLKQKLLHLALSVIGLLLFSVLELVNGLTIHWHPIPLQVSSDTDGVLILLFWGLVLPFAALVRLMLVLIRRNPS